MCSGAWRGLVQDQHATRIDEEKITLKIEHVSQQNHRIFYFLNLLPPVCWYVEVPAHIHTLSIFMSLCYQSEPKDLSPLKVCHWKVNPVS